MPVTLVPQFIRQLHNRTPGWENLIHEDAEFSLLVFEGRTVKGRTAIASELNSWQAALYRPRAIDVQRLDETTALVRGLAQYPRGRGHAAGQVWWLDEIRDGLVWRACGFTSEKAARTYYGRASGSESTSSLGKQALERGAIGRLAVRGQRRPDR